MKKFVILFALLAAGTLFAAAARSGVLPDAYLYPWVDDLNVRTAPNPSLPAFAKLNIGDRVIYLGLVSTNKATYTLRGKQITGYFIKVKMEDGKEGWVFSGALLPYFSERYKTVVTVGIGGDYENLQDAVDDAKPGTVIRLTDGGFKLDRTLKISNKANVVIDGNGADVRVEENANYDVFDIRDSSFVTITGTGFHASGGPYSYCGSVTGSSYVTIAACTFSSPPEGQAATVFIAVSTNVLLAGNGYSGASGYQLIVRDTVSGVSVCGNTLLSSEDAVQLISRDGGSNNFGSDAAVNRAAAGGFCQMRSNRYIPRDER